MRCALHLWFLCPFSLATALGTLELELPVDFPAKSHTLANLVVTFPDSLAGTDLRALILSGDSLRENSLLPGGKLSPDEKAFISGLKNFLAGRTGQSAEIWSTLRRTVSAPILKSCVNVNAGLFAMMRGDLPAAESIWVKERKKRSYAQEGAWRNLLGLHLTRNAFGNARGLLEEVLAETPKNRYAVVAMAALINSTRSDSEWEAFLVEKSVPEDSLAELQLVYGEFLEKRGRYSEAIRVLDRALVKLPLNGRGWKILAEAQYKLGYLYFAQDCLVNAQRAGYHEADLYELFARILNSCCMGGEDPRAAKARQSAEKLLEEGLPRDLHRRSMAQLLYLVYCQNLRPEAAMNLERSLWFHFEGPGQRIPPLANALAKDAGVNALGLSIRLGLHSFTWVTALRDRDLFRAF